MKSQYGLKCIFKLASMACLASALAANAQTLPEGKGRAEFQRICSSCHSVNMATSQRMTHSEWAGVVNDMVSRGAQGSTEDLDNVVIYLSANFGKDKPSAVGAAPAQAAAPAPAAPKQAPLSEAEVSKAKELINANGCLSCHRIGEMGSYLGPDLNDIGESRSPEQLRASLVSPNKVVLPENRMVRIITRDGKTVTGRILNQDGFSVQLIDSSSQLRSFQKSNLQEFTILDRNPMPSYADKMSAEDMTDLIHYLSSLKGAGGQ